MNRYYITDEEYRIAAQNGIARGTLNSRVRSLGWNIEKAITEPLKYQFLKSTLTDEIKEKLKKNRISNNLFYMRINYLGWTVDDAANTPPVSRQESGRRSGEKRRVVSLESYAIAAKNGISNRLVRHRVGHLKWPVERAITEPVNKNEK